MDPESSSMRSRSRSRSPTQRQRSPESSPAPSDHSGRGSRYCEEDEDSSAPTEDQDVEIRTHKNYEQVMLDVRRCAGRLEHIRQVYFHRTDEDGPAEDLTEEFEEMQRLAASQIDEGDQPPQRESCDDGNEDANGELLCRQDHSATKKLLNDHAELKRKLAKLIVKLLIKKPDLHYYQGFHDICLTYMTLLGDVEAFSKLDKLIDSHFETFMKPTMNETQDFLALIPIIIGLKDSQVQEFLVLAEVGTIFALSWVITWFSHVIPNERDVAAIFEFLEERDPHMVLYLCAEIVILKRENLLKLEPEMSTVHHFLCQIPRKEKLPLAQLLDSAINTFSKWPPSVVIKKLDYHRRTKLQVHNQNILMNVASRLGPTITNIVTANKRTAIFVLLLASAVALQIDRWTR